MSSNQHELFVIKNNIDCLKYQRDILANDHMQRQRQLSEQIRC